MSKSTLDAKNQSDRPWVPWGIASRTLKTLSFCIVLSLLANIVALIVAVRISKRPPILVGNAQGTFRDLPQGKISVKRDDVEQKLEVDHRTINR